MKEKFIEWFTAGNSGYAPAIDADGKFEKEKTQHMWEAYQAGLASAEAQVKQLAAERDAVVAENAALKAAFTPEEIPEDAVEAFKETAIMDHDWNDTGEWSWVENDTDVIRAVLEAIKPETPATDAILASLRAEGVEMFALMYAEEAIKDGSDNTDWKARASAAASEYAAQLRSKSEVPS